MHPGARTHVGPPPRFLTSGPGLGFGGWAVGGTRWGAPRAERERVAAVERAIDRDVEERHLPRCDRHGIAFLAYRPLASGLLGGAYRTAPSFPEDDHRRNIYWFSGSEFARRHGAIERLEGLARGRGTSLAALALAWVLARPGVTIVLAGARTAGQVDDNVTAVERPLTADEVREIDAIVAQAFRPLRATPAVRGLVAGWGPRERYIVEQLDGSKTYEAIAAGWTDRGEQPMVAAQVKVFCDQLAERGLVE